MRTPALLQFAAAAAGIAAVLLLACAVLTGLARPGVMVPAFVLTRAAWHGALMIPVFFGTVISLERAVGMQRAVPYLAPAGTVVAGIVLLAGAPAPVVQALLVIAAGILMTASIKLAWRQPTLFLVVLAGAAVCWALGNGVWLTVGDLSAAVPWWLSFLILTIAGERLELPRLLPVTRWGPRQFVIIVMVILASTTGALWWPHGSLRVFAGGLLALAAWLARHDVARHTVRQRGLVRFIDVCLLSGYGWLAVGALLGLTGAFSPGHAWRDAALHAITLGFVFSMLLGHAPLILPAVVRVRLAYHPSFYVPLAVLRVALLARVAGGLSGAFWLRQAGGLASAAAIVLVAFTLLIGAYRTWRRTASGVMSSQ
ncbi:hypothetical protein LMG28688_07144 [Paraburkholderia caffeinitolerans]|uniref:NnrS protein n=1 Tax=Paraburkholderia caffeinitolerans TaxID=1723730 RepID=A0A6J5H2F9_9BURK|nr:hypothetical protein [Paraburkholderia caffeinitolerans]CAB3810072.1 hypothetical protein LMG28688_07144 [Paraburkholderia caffeinitolerans]